MAKSALPVPTSVGTEVVARLAEYQVKVLNPHGLLWRGSKPNRRVCGRPPSPRLVRPCSSGHRALSALTENRYGIPQRDTRT